ncbi:MAG TPA: hypothetical protein VFP92_10830 [Rhodanobacteraceae bacterium]|nr:hypothetical protein [Rhodanobacteraceae bacterium]
MPKRKQQPPMIDHDPEANAPSGGGGHAENPDLVPMVKDGEVLNIHPRAVAEHEQLGWQRQ